MSDVAVAKRGDTGVVVKGDGEGLADTSVVTLDSNGGEYASENAYLISPTFGKGHRFNGEDLEPESLADDRHYVIAKFDVVENGEEKIRLATFHYVPKRTGIQRDGDPFKLTVRNGKRVVQRIKIKEA